MYLIAITHSVEDTTCYYGMEYYLENTTNHLEICYHTICSLECSLYLST